VTWTQGNITYQLVPTQHLPIDQGWRNIGLGFVADVLDAVLRPAIDAAYTNRPNPTAAQLAASTGEQAKIPSPEQIPGPPEPVATLNPPSTASVLASSTNRTPTTAPAGVAASLVTSASAVGHPPAPARPGGVSSVEAGSEVQPPRRVTNAEATKPLTTTSAEAASQAASTPSQTRRSETGGKGHDDRK
jgi:hypothetical protein